CGREQYEQRPSHELCPAPPAAARVTAKPVLESVKKTSVAVSGIVPPGVKLAPPSVVRRSVPLVSSTKPFCADGKESATTREPPQLSVRRLKVWPPSSERRRT